MSGLIMALTLLVLCVPVALFVSGLWRLALAIALLYVGVWVFMRPHSFEVSHVGLDLLFPLRRSRVRRADIVCARVLTKAEFKQEFGFAARVGAGGLWGGFGWLWTTKQGLVDFFISRQDDFVLIERKNERPLLITPERPHELVEELS